jgi:hypothetical protein
MSGGEAPEVALAAEAGPLGEDGEREDLAVGEEGRTAQATLLGGGVVGLPPVVHGDVQ